MSSSNYQKGSGDKGIKGSAVALCRGFFFNLFLFLFRGTTEGPDIEYFVVLESRFDIIDFVIQLNRGVMSYSKKAKTNTKW